MIFGMSELSEVLSFLLFFLIFNYHLSNGPITMPYQQDLQIGNVTQIEESQKSHATI